MNNEFGRMWAEHRDFLRRFLIGLTHNIDLADDLLQETYLYAHAGIAGYRGGDFRAWLAAIAKNAFYMHLRRKYVRVETSLDEETQATGESDLGWEKRLTLFDLRNAVSDLDPSLKTALVMKHYGGYSYKEIAQHMACSVGLAKWRVYAALDKLRTALGVTLEETAGMKCIDLEVAATVDWVYGTLPDRTATRIGRHLSKCPTCRERVASIGNVLKALDAVESDHKATSIIELDKDGAATIYIYFRFLNPTDEAMETLEFTGSTGLRYLTIGGIETPFEPFGPEPQLDQQVRQYRVALPQPIPPRQPVDVVAVDCPKRKAERLDDGHWRFGPGKLTHTEGLLYLASVRLPQGAQFVKADPASADVRADHGTTVTWRSMLPPDQVFEFWVDYQL